MAAKRIAMRKIHEVLRLYFAGQKQRAISRSVRCSRPTVAEYIVRTVNAGISSYAQVAELDEAALQERLFPPSAEPAYKPQRPIPDWNQVHAELRKPKVTRALLWEEYRAEHPDGYGYSQFKALYAKWKRPLQAVMRQEHRAGEKMFVDFCDGLYLTDRQTGEKRLTQLFVGALGASSYTFAMATESQDLHNWLHCHVRAFEFYQGVPAITVCDNLMSGVRRPCRYEPAVNRSYNDLAIHYGTCVMPARVYKPRDKAKVESNVLVAQHWILAALRNDTFYNLAEINAAIREKLEKLNNRKMRHIGKSRHELYELWDRPVLKALPTSPFVICDWAKATVNVDYHVVYDGHFYSVPFTLIQEVVDIRATALTIEAFYQGRRVASHVRSQAKNHHSTCADHMPSAHRAHAQWTPERIVTWAGRIGKSTATLVEAMIAEKYHPEQAFRSALGIIRLADKHSPAAVEQASGRALAMAAPNYQTVKHLLQSPPVPKEFQPVESSASLAYGHLRANYQ